MRRLLHRVTVLAALVAAIVVNIGQAEVPRERTKEQVAFDHNLRLKVEKVTPAKGPRRDWLKLDVVRHYGKISRDSYAFALQNETQRFLILFPVKPGAVVKPGDIIDYEYSSFLGLSDPNNAQPEQTDEGGHTVDPNAEPAQQFQKPPGPDLATLEGTLQVHPKFLYHEYLVIDGIGQQICALYGTDRKPSDLLTKFKPGTHLRVQGRLGTFQSRGSTPENPSPFPKMWVVYMDLQHVESLESPQ
jgi:hypothetical protein